MVTSDFLDQLISESNLIGTTSLTHADLLSVRTLRDIYRPDGVIGNAYFSKDFMEVPRDLTRKLPGDSLGIVRLEYNLRNTNLGHGNIEQGNACAYFAVRNNSQGEHLEDFKVVRVL